MTRCRIPKFPSCRAPIRITSIRRRISSIIVTSLNPPGLDEKELQKRTLTNLYNAKPDWLAAAHRRLDAAVFAAYGWPDDLADEEILERLLALNLARAGV